MKNPPVEGRAYIGRSRGFRDLDSRPADVAAARHYLAGVLPRVSEILEKASVALERGDEAAVVLTDYADDWPREEGAHELEPAARRIANFMLLDALRRQGLQASVREISWAGYQQWLGGRADDRAQRAAYAAGAEAPNERA